MEILGTFTELEILKMIFRQVNTALLVIITGVLMYTGRCNSDAGMTLMGTLCGYLYGQE